MYQLFEIKNGAELLISTGTFLEMIALKRKLFSKTLGKLIIKEFYEQT